MAGESSIDSWDKLTTMTPEIAKRLKPHVFMIDRKTGEIRIAYTSELFEPGNMPSIMSSIAGNIFGMKSLKHLRFQDIHFPEEIIKSFRGPALGIEGVRRILRVKERPLVGTIVKPKVGLTASQHAEVAFESWVGGLDLVKDDENLVSMKFNRFEDRVVKTLEMADKAEEQTGEKKVYVANVTSEAKEMVRRAEFVKKHGGKCAMIDIITAGWSSLQTLRNADLGLIIHAHRAGHGMFTEDPRQGMSMLAVAKIARLLGVDQIHIGAIFGKMKGGKEAVKRIGEEIEERFVKEEWKGHVLEQDWFNVKPTFAICSGGLHAGQLPYLVRELGNNIICQAGAGVHAHPQGTMAGAASIRQSIDAVMEGKSLKEYAKTHKELDAAIRKWGVSEHKSYRY